MSDLIEIIVAEEVVNIVEMAGEAVTIVEVAEQGPAGPAADPIEGKGLKGVYETAPASIDATAGGTFDLDYAAGQARHVNLGTAAVTFTFSNFPAGSGKSGSMTVRLSFTGATKPTITWPASLTGAPNVSGATDSTGHALVEVYNDGGGYWLLLAGVV